MKNIAICIGINKFKNLPDATLSGCVNDAIDMAHFFALRKIQKVVTLTDEKATKEVIISLIRASIEEDYDEIYISYSSHGTQVEDVSGDESDMVDEAFVCYDTTADFENLIVDDELYALFLDAPKSTKIEVWLDTCHSGTGLKKMSSTRRVKFLPNPKIFKYVTVKQKAITKQKSNVILWSGCKDNEYSSDTEFDGKPNGAFTYYFLQMANKYSNSWRRTIHSKFINTLAEEYQQTPQLEATMCNKFKRLFK